MVTRSRESFATLCPRMRILLSAWAKSRHSALEQIMDANLRGLAAVRHWPRLPPLSPSCRNGSNSPMAEGDRIIPHRGVDDDSGVLRYGSRTDGNRSGFIGTTLSHAG